jgi:O-antigen/teichoic acid export membrane protein
MASSFYTTQMPTTMAYYMALRLCENAVPAINELWGRRHLDKLGGALSRLTRLVLAIILPLPTGVILFSRDLVVTRVGPRQYAGTLMTMSLAAFCTIACLQRIGVVYSFAFGWIRLLTATAILQGVANVGFAYCLAKWLGLGGIMLALPVVILPQTIIVWRRIAHFLEVNVLAVLGECVARALIPLGGATACGLLVHRVVVIQQRHFFGLFAETLSFVLVYAALAYPLGLTDHDRGKVRRYLSALLGRGERLPRFLARAFGSSAN